MKTLSLEGRRAVSLLYIGAAVILIAELLEISSMILPPHSAVASWRFGVLGITVSRIPSLVIADVMFLAAALVLGHRRTLIMASGAHLLFSLLLVPAMALYTLDALLMRRVVRPELRFSFDATALRALAVTFVTCISAFLVFLLLRRAIPHVAPRSATPQGIVVGAATGSGRGNA